MTDVIYQNHVACMKEMCYLLKIH